MFQHEDDGSEDPLIPVSEETEELSLEALAELESEGSDPRSHTFSPDDEAYFDGAYFEE